MTMPADAPCVGGLGCGNMVSAIARHLAGAGHRVSAWNRTASRANALTGLGVHVAPTVQALTAEADVVLAVVSSDIDLRSAPSGVEFTPGTVLVNLVTGTTSDAADLQRDLEERGLRYLDGAIASYPEAIGTADGSLLIAGPRSTWIDVRVLIESLGGKSRHVSDDVRGANVLDVGVVGGYYISTLVALIEAAAYARDAGIARRSCGLSMRAVIEPTSSRLRPASCSKPSNSGYPTTRSTPRCFADTTTTRRPEGNSGRQTTPKEGDH